MVIGMGSLFSKWHRFCFEVTKKGSTNVKPILFAVISMPSVTRRQTRIVLLLQTHANAKVLLVSLNGLAWTPPGTLGFGNKLNL
jgi:hypothetical protein